MDNADLRALINNIEKVIVGKTETIKLLIVGLLTNGHILIEDVPGLGKKILVWLRPHSLHLDSYCRYRFRLDPEPLEPDRF